MNIKGSPKMSSSQNFEIRRQAGTWKNEFVIEIISRFTSVSIIAMLINLHNKNQHLEQDLGNLADLANPASYEAAHQDVPRLPKTPRQSLKNSFDQVLQTKMLEQEQNNRSLKRSLEQFL